jgi:DegV family protein with EDD domain
MSISSKISGTYNAAVSAAERIKADFPECKIECIDTLRMSGSFGLLVVYALELQKNGASMEEIVAWLNENKHRVHQMGPIDDMTFIARRGRITMGKAFMGNLVGIKPMGDSNRDGFVSVLAKVKGISTALDATVGYIEELATDVENQYIYIAHTDREKHALDLQARIKAKINCKDVFVSDVFSACGTNIGPGMISVYFLGDPISEDCEKEKEALNRAIAKLK